MKNFILIKHIINIGILSCLLFITIIFGLEKTFAVNYAVLGEYVSPAVGNSTVKSLESFVPINLNLPENTQIDFGFSFSQDGINFTDAQGAGFSVFPGTKEAEYGLDDAKKGAGMDNAKYIKTKISLKTNNSAVSPSLDGFSIKYISEDTLQTAVPAINQDQNNASTSTVASQAAKSSMDQIKSLVSTGTSFWTIIIIALIIAGIYFLAISRGKKRIIVLIVILLLAVILAAIFFVAKSGKITIFGDTFEREFIMKEYEKLNQGTFDSSKITIENQEGIGRIKLKNLENNTQNTKINYLNPKEHSGTYNYSLQFPLNTSVNELALYVPVPAEWDSQKNIEIKNVNPSSIIKNDGLNNNFLEYNKSNLANNNIDMNEQIKFTGYEIKTVLSDSSKIDYDTNSELYKKYIANENKIEVDNLKNAAEELTKNETQTIEKVKMIYDYVIDNMKYTLQGGQLRGAEYAYDKKEGECGDYSALFVAMARATGIPARPVVGFWTDSSLGSTHVWAEFYVQDVGWIPVDPTIGQQSSEKRIYYFGNLDNNRLIMSKNFNIGFDNSGHTADLFQIGAYWWQGSGDVPTIEYNYSGN